MKAKGRPIIYWDKRHISNRENMRLKRRERRKKEIDFERSSKRQ